MKAAINKTLEIQKSQLPEGESLVVPPSEH